LCGSEFLAPRRVACKLPADALSLLISRSGDPPQPGAGSQGNVGHLPFCFLAVRIRFAGRPVAILIIYAHEANVRFLSALLFFLYSFGGMCLLGTIHHDQFNLYMHLLIKHTVLLILCTCISSLCLLFHHIYKLLFILDDNDLHCIIPWVKVVKSLNMSLYCRTCLYAHQIGMGSHANNNIIIYISLTRRQT
jgi:hypothetical protein